MTSQWWTLRSRYTFWKGEMSMNSFVWIFRKNFHLCPPWMTILEKVECWLIIESHLAVRQQFAQKIVLELLKRSRTMLWQTFLPGFQFLWNMVYRVLAIFKLILSIRWKVGLKRKINHVILILYMVQPLFESSPYSSPFPLVAFGLSNKF